MFNKRGQSPQYNWVFVMVAGTLFLLFLIGFGFSYIGLSNDRNSAKIELALDGVIDGAKSQQQYRTFKAGNRDFDLRYECEDDSESTLSINKQQGININDVVFVENGEYKELIVWSSEFKQPFFVSNLVYLIDKNKKYYFDDPNLNIPSIINVVSSENEADVVVKENGDVWWDDENVYYKNGDVIDVRDINKNSLKLGAVFSNSESFECGVNKLKLRRDFVDTVYEVKRNLLTGCNYDALDFSDRENLEDLNEDLADAECEVVF